MELQTITQPRGNMVYPDQIRDTLNQLHSITKMLSEITNIIPGLRRVFRGEVLYQDEKGLSTWVQMVKPAFVKVDFLSGKPVKQLIKTPWGEDKEIFVANDEAIEEILSMISFMGVNQITAITNLSEDNILDDLREFELKLARILALKQKEWGLDKELLPMIQTKIKTQVQDVRMMACEGGTLKAIQTTVQRMEQIIEGDKAAKRIMGANPFG